MLFVCPLRPALHGKVLSINITTKEYYQLWENGNTHV
jgi:hypothetical protein